MCSIALICFFAPDLPGPGPLHHEQLQVRRRHRLWRPLRQQLRLPQAQQPHPGGLVQPVDGGGLQSERPVYVPPAVLVCTLVLLGHVVDVQLVNVR